MIIFDGTKLVGKQTALVFKNDQGKTVDLVLNAPTLQFILSNFQRLMPPTTVSVEYQEPQDLGQKEMIRIHPKGK